MTNITIVSIAITITQGIDLCKHKEYEQGYAILAKAPPHNMYPEAYFYRAVAAHQLSKKKEALADIDRLLNGWFNVPVPQRYIALAYTMQADISLWKDDGLEPIGRKMYNISRRLQLNKGGRTTRKQQREVILRLDEIIKKLENEQKLGKATGCPIEISKYKQDGILPLDDSKLGGVKGEGKATRKLIKDTASVWGSLPDKERAKAMIEISRDVPTKYRYLIEKYFKELQNGYSKAKGY
jgi:hypothetical protein